MAKLPRSKIVRETEEYDDLLKVSAQTRKLLKKPVAKKPPAKKQKPAAKPKPEISSLKVHLPNRKAADAFAKLLQRPLSLRSAPPHDDLSVREPLHSKISGSI